MAHSLIIGQTESGKTTLAKQIAHKLQSNNNVLVLDPIADPDWQADFVTSDINHFMQVAKANTECFLIIDESGENLGQFDNENFWLATRARHYGHSSIFIAQRVQMIAPTVRNQTSYLMLFNVSYDDSKTLSNEYNNRGLLDAFQLQKGEYFYCSRFGQLQKRKVKFKWQL